jgi:hypothetical protein
VDTIEYWHRMAVVLLRRMDSLVELDKNEIEFLNNGKNVPGIVLTSPVIARNNYSLGVVDYESSGKVFVSVEGDVDPPNDVIEESADVSVMRLIDRAKEN